MNYANKGILNEFLMAVKYNGNVKIGVTSILHLNEQYMTIQIFLMLYRHNIISN